MQVIKENPKTNKMKTILLICLCLFICSVGVRLLVWQNNQEEINQNLWFIVTEYQKEAKLLLSGDFRTFLAGQNPPGNAEVLSHPPGYSILIASIFAVFGDSAEILRVFQILLNSLAPLLVFLIALKLFDSKTAVIAGILAALSPQISYNSVLLLADSVAVLPILLALYFFIRAYQKESLPDVILCGVLLGISCWLRANGLLLPVFFAGISLILLAKKIRIRFALALMAAFVLIIIPITIRNYVVFDSFIPIALGTGINLVEGIGDYDKEGKFGMPPTDDGLKEMEVKLYNRPDYMTHHYNPDGILRERARTKMALELISANPFWFAGVVIQRGFMIMRLERVPAISSKNDEKESTNALAYYLNIPLKFIQKLFITGIFLPLFILGVIILCREKEQRKKLLILLIIPLYYVSVHSLIHTEYRYVVAVQHIVLIIAAVVISFLIDKIKERIFKVQS